ncbi:non-canonical purine NTP pyrophosphatase, partial [Candidatus Pelagibacter sp.]|nr:non-canonical purine NTP pyrophosphatase [Candidatus Pelagibacter sp.]
MLKKKITKLLVGTNNRGKLREIKDLLPKKLQIYSPYDLKIKSPIENGKSFKENSLIKAKFFSEKSKMICLSDDSGLEVDLLNGKPGIYSARWGGKKGDFIKAMKRVFKELYKKDRNWKNKKIKARFVCSLTIYYPNKKIINS